MAKYKALKDFKFRGSLTGEILTVKKGQIVEIMNNLTSPEIENKMLTLNYVRAVKKKDE